MGEARESGGRVLIVEDEEDIRDALCDTLRATRFKVVSAANGREALERLSIPPLPDVVLLDLMLPILNGFELLAALRELGLGKIPVVVLSKSRGYSRDDLGTFAVLRKPIIADVLLSCIAGAVFRSRAQHRA